ncbi:MAG: hypothetical protein NTZ26_01335 [Candidatus Aminicenantes bacterium]|nr:hypothetical protein [Candidatus Aminicenantes bacterium]
MNDDFKTIERRTIRHFYEDGLTELVIGAILFLWGGFFYLRPGRKGEAGYSLSDTAFFLVIILAVLLATYLLRFLKRRITYPRAGYVSYPKKDRPGRQRLAAVSGGIIAALLSALTASSPSARAWYPAIDGFLIGIAFLVLAAKLGALRFHILAVVSAALGTGIAAAGIVYIRGVILYGALMGAALTLSGAVTLARFLHRNKPAGEDAVER